MEPPFTDLAPLIPLAILAILVLLVGALAGSAGFALVQHRQVRRIAELTEQLATGGEPASPAAMRRIRDPRLRASFDRLGESLAETWALATRDQLTQVANRQTLLTRLDEEIERATRYGRRLSIAMIDVDHFKRLNDTYGHSAGDLVLHRIAQAIEASVRRVDIVGRYGGEEFMVVLPETDVDAAASITEKIRRFVGREEVVLPDGSLVGATLSAGVAGGLGADLRLDDLVRDADAALYSAKSLGRDQVYVFHEVEDDGRIRRASIAPEAREHAMDVGRAALGAATDALATVLSTRPGWAGKPSTMIAESAAVVAESLGLPVGEIERIRTASLLHDLGKLAIPDEILAKPSDLDEAEWRVVTEHPKIGHVVLEHAGALRDAATIVLHHHEWYDGRGYPHGLTGHQIPIGSRIVAVSDAYEAMVSGRPYRIAISHERALDELRRHAGLQFDPEIVEQFVALFASGMPWEPSADHGHDHPHDDDHPHGHDHAQRPEDGHEVEVGHERAGGHGLGDERTRGGRHGASRRRGRRPSDAAATAAEPDVADPDHRATHDALHARRRRMAAAG